jgi:TonB family protein
MLLCPLFAGAALAQTGPLQARMVFAADMPTGFPTYSDQRTDRSAIVKMAVGPDGQVQSAAIEESMGDPEFEQKILDYAKRIRMIPALDEQGTAIVGTSRIKFKTKTVYSWNRVTALPVIAAAVVYDESGRILRMTCKDFLWEYDLMRELAHDKPIDNEQMLLTAIAMYGSKHQIPNESLWKLTHVAPSSIRISAGKCRATPTELFWGGVLEPTVTARLAK